MYATDGFGPPVRRPTLLRIFVVQKDMSEFLNPVSAALGIIEQYRQSIRKALVRGGLADSQAKKVLDHLSLSAGASTQPIDPQIWFTLRREFDRSDCSLAALAHELGMSEKIVAAF